MPKPKKLIVDEPQYLSRALAAWYRSGATDQPTASYVTTHKGLTYVVLQHARGVQVYRIKNDGLLRALRRWPDQVERPGGRVPHTPVVAKGAKG